MKNAKEKETPQHVPRAGKGRRKNALSKKRCYALKTNQKSL